MEIGRCHLSRRLITLALGPFQPGTLVVEDAENKGLTFTNSARGKANEEYALRVTVPLSNVRRSRRAHPASAVENDLLIGPWLLKPVLLLELLR